MKTAIIYNGNVRTFDQTIDNNIEKFQFLNPDYFVTTYYTKYGYHPAVRNSINFHIDEVLSYEKLLEYFNNLNICGITVDTIEDMCSIYKSSQINPNMNHESSFLQYLKLKSGLEMTKYREYDVIIKTRCDLLLNDINNIDFSNIDNEIIVDKGNLFPNDCIFMSSAKNMYKMIDFMVSEFYNVTDFLSTQHPPHGVLHAACNNLNLNIKQYHIIDCVIRANTRIYL